MLEEYLTSPGINYLSNSEETSPISLMEVSSAELFLKWFKCIKQKRNSINFWFQEIIDTKELKHILNLPPK